MEPTRPPPPQLKSGRSLHLTEGQAETPEHPQRHEAGPQAGDRQPQYSGGFSVIPPNQTRRSQIQMVAQKGEETLQRLKEQQRVQYVHETPETLGGHATLAEVRLKQQTDLRCSKVQRRMKQKEMDERKRREEEAENQRKKDEQRKKADRQAQREQQEQQRRREQFQQDRLRKTDGFLQRFETTAPDPLSCSGATHTSSTREAAESRRGKTVSDVQLDHRRVNSAFLDKLQGRGAGSEGETETEGHQEAEWPSVASDDLEHEPWTRTPPDAEQGWTQEAELDPDHDRALVKLMSSFPDYSRVFLQDILLQCHGDFDQAFALLS